MKTLIALITLALVPSFHAPALMARQDSQTVVEQVHIRGNRRIAEATIKSFISTRGGDDYDPARLNRDLRAIYDTGNFRDINLFVEDGLQGGKVITFSVMEWPLIADVVFQGLDSTEQARVLEELQKRDAGVSKGSAYSPARVKGAAKIIEDFLSLHGYSDVKVAPLIQSGSSTEVIVKFRVSFRSSR